MLVLVLVNIASLNIVHNHFCFNDYMERIISSTESQYFHYLHLYLHSFELIVQCHPLPGEYGEDLEQMGFNDESETDLPGQRQVLRRPCRAQWHGEIFNTNFENWKTVYVSEY